MVQLEGFARMLPRSKPICPGKGRDGRSRGSRASVVGWSGVLDRMRKTYCRRLLRCYQSSSSSMFRRNSRSSWWIAIVVVSGSE
ncbi:hypothetical protein K474DRAFT_1700725 [Panus rudis PR-1116 ss-1]|nr:hypothetical protein K474DRAFT_1700725 [Panus rudis PR-1116 ss-1]